MILRPSLLMGVNHSGVPRNSIFLLHQELKCRWIERQGGDSGECNVSVIRFVNFQKVEQQFQLLKSTREWILGGTVLHV